MAVPAILEYSLDAPLVKVARYRPQRGREMWRGGRAEIREFSAKSQSRLRTYIGRVHRGAWRGALFVTLTIHPDLYPGGRGCKRYLDRWLQEMMQRFPMAYYFWKMEYHRSGRVHFHCLFFGVSDGVLFERVGRWQWWKLIRPKDLYARHYMRVVKNSMLRGCHVERVRSERFAAMYVSKYVGKGFGGIAEEYPGRFWGKSRDFKDLWARYRVLALERGRDACRLWRQLRKVRRGPKRGWWRVCAGPRYVFLNDVTLVEKLLQLLGIRHRLIDIEEPRWHENRYLLRQANSLNLADLRYERFGSSAILSKACGRQRGLCRARRSGGSWSCFPVDACVSG